MEENQSLSWNCGEVCESQSEENPDRHNCSNEAVLTNEEDTEEQSAEENADCGHQTVKWNFIQKCTKNDS